MKLVQPMHPFAPLVHLNENASDRLGVGQQAVLLYKQYYAHLQKLVWLVDARCSVDIKNRHASLVLIY